VQLVAKACHYELVWNYKNYKIGLGSKFNRFVGQVWPKEKKSLFMSRMKGLTSMQWLTLNLIFGCEFFDFEESFLKTCFDHVFSKTCQYDTTYEKVCKKLIYVFIKFTQIYLQKFITWPKKSLKGRQEWDKTYIKVKICLTKLNNLFKIR
jgi:hypothetical protein